MSDTYRKTAGDLALHTLERLISDLQDARGYLLRDGDEPVREKIFANIINARKALYPNTDDQA